MADYCTIDEVASWLPNGQTLDDQTDKKPLRATVVLWIPKITAAINAAMVDQGKAVPLTGDEAIAAGLIEAREAAYQIMAVRNQKVDVTEGDATFLSWHQEYLTFIGATVEAAAAAASAVILAPSSYTMEAPSTTDLTINPKITREQAHNW